jgi:hypothetical protein
VSVERRRGFRPDHKSFGMHIRSEVAREPAMQIAREIAKLASATATIQSPESTARESKKRRRRKPVAASGYKARPDGNLMVGKSFPASRAIAVVEIINPNAPFDEGGTKNFRGNRTLIKAAHKVSVRKLGRFDGYGAAS